MSNPRNTYFRTPTRDHPPDACIVLGSVIELAKWPEETVLSDKILPIPPSMGPYPHTVKGWSSGDKRLHEWNPSIFASFMKSILGIGVTLGLGSRSSDIVEIKAKSLDTLTFAPSPQYIADAMRADLIAKKLRSKRIWELSSKVYMVTGIKIARGASVITKKIKEKSGMAEFSANLAVVSAGTVPLPLTFGPKLNYKHTNEQTVSCEASDDFVYAYRLARITITEGKPVAKPYYRGTVLDDDSKVMDEDVHLEFEAEEADAEDDFEGLSTEILDSDGTQVILVTSEEETGGEEA